MYLELNAKEAALEPPERHFIPGYRISVRLVGQGRADLEPFSTRAALRHRVEVKAAEANSFAAAA